jgi:hypothetical protein
MTEYFPELIQFNIPFIFFLLIFGLSAASGFWFYRFTNPQNSFFIRLLLASLRSLLLFLVIILILNPNILYRFIEQKPKTVALFIDHSASMGLENSSENRQEVTDKTVTTIRQMALKKNLKMPTYYFNEAVFSTPKDSLSKPFGLTNFNNLEKFIQKNNLDQVIIVSDGMRTEGIVPKVGPTGKIFTIGIGNTQVAQDVAIINVDFNPVVYRAKDNKLSVHIISKKVSSGAARLQLYNEGRLIDKKTVHFSGDNTEQEITFTYKPEKTGVQKFTIKLLPEVPDANSKNNMYVFTQKVLKSKIRVGIFSATPNYEHKFIKFVLNQTENIEARSFIKIKNKNMSDYSTDSLDVIIFQNYPAHNSTPAELLKIKNSLVKNHPGFLILAGRKINLTKLEMFVDFMPIKNLRPRSKSEKGLFLPPGKTSIHSLLNLFNDAPLNTSYWNNMPPVAINFSTVAKEKSKVLLEANKRGLSANGLIILENNGLKSALINGSGLWKWHFLLRDNPDYKSGYKNLMVNLVRWSANNEKFKPVVLEVNKNGANPGQEIILKGFIYSAQNTLVKSGRMEVDAEWQGENFTIQMEKDSSGAFIARYKPIGEGAYTFKVDGFIGSDKIGEARQMVQVLPYNREFVRTNLDTLFLKRLAEESDGMFFSAQNAVKVFDYLDLADTQIMHTNEVELRYKNWLLYVIIFIAAMEWIIRKKNNLA